MELKLLVDYYLVPIIGNIDIVLSEFKFRKDPIHENQVTTYKDELLDISLSPEEVNSTFIKDKLLTTRHHISNLKLTLSSEDAKSIISIMNTGGKIHTDKITENYKVIIKILSPDFETKLFNNFMTDYVVNSDNTYTILFSSNGTEVNEITNWDVT